jgi:hypothetical protein
MQLQRGSYTLSPSAYTAEGFRRTGSGDGGSFAHAFRQGEGEDLESAYAIKAPKPKKSGSEFMSNISQASESHQGPMLQGFASSEEGVSAMDPTAGMEAMSQVAQQSFQARGDIYAGKAQAKMHEWTEEQNIRGYRDRVKMQEEAQKKAERKQRRGGLFGAIGTIAGGLLGGPVGAGIGGAIGGLFG